MTSGHFHNVPIDSIQANREGRQRRELTGISELADSIHRLGLIQPLVVTRGLDLVAGERRLVACQSLGHTHISVQYTDELEAYTLRSIELEENIKRENLPWHDECLAVHEYFQLRKSEDPNFNQTDLGTALGLSKAPVSERMMVARELLAGNERIAELTKNPSSKLSTAVGIAERANDRRYAQDLDQFNRLAGIESEQAPEPILNLDFNEWAKSYAGPKFNFVHCDFPYGIESDSFNQGAASTHGGYVDTSRTYWTLCESLSHGLRRLTTDSCHFMFWFSMWNYNTTLDYFRNNSDITFDPFPLVWLKSDNVGILPDPQRGPRRIYETALFGSRGDRKIVSSVSNAYAAPTDRGFHMSVKPEPVLRNFFRMFVDEHTTMLDPTAGSGSSLRAAESLNAHYVLGLEINNDFCEQANRALRNARTLRKPR